MTKCRKSKMKRMKAKRSIARIRPRIEPLVLPVNGIRMPPVKPPPDRPGRLTNVLESLKWVLGTLYKSRWSNYFKDPMDESLYSISEFNKQIRHPMDLATIEQRLANNYYWRANEALEDFELFFDNCDTLYRYRSDVRAAGRNLRSIFRTNLSLIDMSKEFDLNTETLPQCQTESDPQQECEYPDSDQLAREEEGAYYTPFRYGIDSDSDHDNEPEPDPKPLEPTPDIMIDWQIYLVEKNHALRLLECLTKRKRDHINWPFRNVELWRFYSANSRYEHDDEEKLDWQTLRLLLENNKIKSFEHFIERLRTMFKNALACFPNNDSVVGATTALNDIVESRLHAFRSSLTEAKKRIRYTMNKKLRDYKLIIAQQDSYISSEERFPYGWNYQQFR